MAAAAATGDPRFMSDPITCHELEELEVEISVLSPLKQVSEPLKEIQLGIHGIVIESRAGRGTFLPQVATETGWSRGISRPLLQRKGLHRLGRVEKPLDQDLHLHGDYHT